MEYSKLPEVKHIKIPETSYFPNNFYKAVFRLWETCSSQRIAKALETDVSTIENAAYQMGLPKQKYTDKWQNRGYITTIRNAWYLLPYEQLLTLLDWSEEKLATVLKEEDFLSHKLGNFKPYVEKVTVQTVGNDQLSHISNTMKKYFSNIFSGDVPFSFVYDFEGDIYTTHSDGIRMVYSYCGLYSTVLDEDIDISYPEKLLKAYQSSGINAIWLSVVLYQMVEFPFDKSYSVGYEKRRENLKLLVEKAKKYGIKVFLYLNEPRCMPIDFFDKHPELLGKKVMGNGTLCTSVPAVMDYLRFAVEDLCRAVPDIGGFFCITMSENLTHCKSIQSDSECDRCKDIPAHELVSNVITAISESSRKVNPDIRLIAWTWAWDDVMTHEEIEKCICSIPKEVIIQTTSDFKNKFTLAGIEGVVDDYSISKPGPSDVAKFIWNCARKSGHETSAKVQVNVTWECSSIPFIPTFDLIRELMTGLKKEDVEHLMLSWTLGGYPSINLKVASSCLNDPSEEKYNSLLKDEFGDDWEKVKKASRLFSEAFREFPFSIRSAYYGPQNAGPSTLLYETPTGLDSTMTCFAFDDIDMWTSIYPRDVFYPKDIYIDQFRKIAEKWKEGLDIIKDMPESLYTLSAKGAYALFNSSYLQSLFIDKRLSGDNELLCSIVSQEKENALLMYELMTKSSLFGFEASNHYYFNKMMMAEKVLNCESLEKLYNK